MDERALLERMDRNLDQTRLIGLDVRELTGEIRELTGEIRDLRVAGTEELRALRETSNLQTEELRAMRQTSDARTEELRQSCARCARPATPTPGSCSGRSNVSIGAAEPQLRAQPAGGSTTTQWFRAREIAT